MHYYKYDNSPCQCLLNCYFLGCGRCWTVDGNWKLCFTHCMYPVKVTISGLSVNFPDVCTEEPINSKSAFCHHHHEVATHHSYPTDVRGFLKFCGTSSCNHYLYTIILLYYHIAEKFCYFAKPSYLYIAQKYLAA